ncbi:MAG: HEPN domain-containing protein [Candidatus Korarchaeum sp.]
MGPEAGVEGRGGDRHLNTYAMAKAYIEDAERSYREAELSLNERAFHRCIRRAQECVELSLKGMLRLLGVEYPKSHDVSLALERAREEVGMPDWLRDEVEDLKRISMDLAMKRGPAFYGDERAFIPPESLYSEEDAIEALEMALRTLKAAKRLLEAYER